MIADQVRKTTGQGPTTQGRGAATRDQGVTVQDPGAATPSRDAVGDQGSIGPVLAALADPTRRQLLEALAGEGQASATRLASRLPVSRQAVVKHLRVLEDTGLVTGARAGREVLYHVRPGPLDASAAWLANLAAAWDRRLATLKHSAEAAASGAQPDPFG
jgi:DNA-binding transcriptional ArsR family regulator